MLLLHHINQCFCEVPVAYHCHMSWVLGIDLGLLLNMVSTVCWLPSEANIGHKIIALQSDISSHCSMSLCVAIGYTSCVFIWNALEDSDNSLWLFSPSNRHPCFRATRTQWSLFIIGPRMSPSLVVLGVETQTEGAGRCCQLSCWSWSA